MERAPAHLASPESPGAIFARFLKFGLLAWGGPAAQIAMIKHECVARERMGFGGELQETARRLPVVRRPTLRLRRLQSATDSLPTR